MVPTCLRSALPPDSAMVAVLNAIMLKLDVNVITEMPLLITVT